MSGGAAQLFGYDQSVKQLPRPCYPAEQVVGDRFPGEAPLPAGGEREERALAVYPRRFLKKAATGSKEALVERFSLST